MQLQLQTLQKNKKTKLLPPTPTPTPPRCCRNRNHCRYQTINQLKTTTTTTTKYRNLTHQQTNDLPINAPTHMQRKTIKNGKTMRIHHI